MQAVSEAVIFVGCLRGCHLCRLFQRLSLQAVSEAVVFAGSSSYPRFPTSVLCTSVSHLMLLAQGFSSCVQLGPCGFQQMVSSALTNDISRLLLPSPTADSLASTTGGTSSNFLNLTGSRRWYALAW